MMKTGLRFSVETGADGTICISQDTDLIVMLPQEVDTLVKWLEEAKRELDLPERRVTQNQSN
jgi:hypothetical protein